MINTNNMDALEWLRKHLDEDDNDLVREMVRAFAERLMGAEADAMCGAGYGEVNPDRVNLGNGYRERRCDTPAGTIDLPIPKLRESTYYPDRLLEPRRPLHLRVGRRPHSVTPGGGPDRERRRRHRGRRERRRAPRSAGWWT